MSDAGQVPEPALATEPDADARKPEPQTSPN